MENEVQSFLQAEKTAVELAETLKQLYDETVSYQTATRELEAVRQRLLGLIGSTEKIVISSSAIIGTLKEIGTPEILSRVIEAESRTKRQIAEHTHEIMGALTGEKTQILSNRLIR